MLLYEVLHLYPWEKIYKKSYKKEILKCYLHHRMRNLNYLMSHMLRSFLVYQQKTWISN